MPRCIHIIVNPASGREPPDLETLIYALRSAGVEWNLSVTRQAGDARHLTRAALEAGADVVVAYGGDGTIADTATALAGTHVPLGIIPGGAANVIASTLGISTDVKEAATLVCQEPTQWSVAIDLMALQSSRLVVVQASVGLPVAMMQAARRTQKKRWGRWAYLRGLLNTLWQPKTYHFRLTLDGRTVKRNGAACLICNSGRFGLGALQLHPAITCTDGFLDVLLLRRASPWALLSLLIDAALHRPPASRYMLHYRARAVHFDADGAPHLQADGNVVGRLPAVARALPGALRVLVPQPSLTRTPSTHPSLSTS